MGLNGKKLGFALTGAYHNFEKVFLVIKRLADEGFEVMPIISTNVSTAVTKFGTGMDFKKRLYEITHRLPAETVGETEPIGPKGLLDALVIAPCTGNTLAKIANAVTDTPVVMAAKSQLRGQKPVVIAISTNDGLGLNAKNIGVLLNSKNVYFVPFGQDCPEIKPNSLVADFDMIPDTLKMALEGRQIQPVLTACRKKLPASVSGS